MSMYRLVFLTLAINGISSLSIFYLYDKLTHRSQQCPKGMVCLDVNTTVCYPFDFSKTKWLLLPYAKREEVGILVRDGKLFWMEADLIDCYQKDPYEPDLGEKLVTLKAEAYKIHENKR